jgi:Arc/MetJ family transcription regulator
MRKIRVNITVDKELLEQAKKRIDLFGGKISTLFNSYLRDFVKSMDKNYSSEHKEMALKIKELEERLRKLEGHK